MWPRRSHTLATLSILTYIKRRFKLTQFELDAFEKIKRIVARNTLLTYPDFNEIFKMNTDANAFQLGAVIRHKEKPIAFYSINLTNAQRWYTVPEREIISIIETLKDFRTILPGKKLIIYTNHKKLPVKF